MSRIGKKPITLPNGVTVDVKDQVLTAKGPKGEITVELHPNVIVSIEDGVANVTVADVSEDAAVWGTMRALVSNAVQGVNEGWKKVLELNGVGFKMNIQGKTLVLALGFSHEINYDLPEGIDASIEGNKLTIAGIDRQLVGQTAAEIRAFKKPEPYKGKGFKYEDEIIRRKAGKTAKGD